LYKILIVEDAHSEYTFLKENYIDWLKYNIAAIEEASNGKEGFEKAMIFLPYIVIIDIMMPVMDGLEMISLLKANGLESKIITNYNNPIKLNKNFRKDNEPYIT